MEADILIAGAGCAGLSLAVHLLEESRRELRLAIIDPRQDFERDRTWCYWSLHRHPFEAAVTHAWNSWRVAWEGGTSVRRSDSVSYHYLPSDAFYRLALSRLAARPDVKLVLGKRVEEIEDTGDGIVARTDAGTVRARLAFDGRPPARSVPGRAGRHVALLQHFLGLLVEADYPCFDPTTATLMDFRVEQSEGIHFMYVLPLDRRRALVEDTFFGGTPQRADAHLESIRRYLADRCGLAAWRTLHREKGVIPMDTRIPEARTRSRICPIGVRAGLARPASGYAFLAIQRDSVRLARVVANQGVSGPITAAVPYGKATAFLDRVFLSYLLRQPDQAPRLFAALFGRVEPVSLARFLFDGGTAADRLRVMASLPKVALTAEALRCLAAG